MEVLDIVKRITNIKIYKLNFEKRLCAFVFARGGSKGLPKKNILKINDIPLVAHGILQSKKIDEIERIFVSSDSEEIGKIAIAYGAEWIKRPLDLASDSASEWLAWQHAIKYVQENYGQFDSFLSLPATAPLRALKDIKKALNTLKNDIDIVVSMTKSKGVPGLIW